MHNRLRNIIAAILFGCFVFTSCFHRTPVLKCLCDEQMLKDSIKRMFDADSVFLQTGYLSQTTHTPAVKSFSLTIINGTTNAVDFKPLPAKHRKLENVDFNALQKETDAVAQILFDNYNSKDFNSIAVYFSKYDSTGSLVPLYQYHYSRELFPEAWAKY